MASQRLIGGVTVSFQHILASFSLDNKNCQLSKCFFENFVLDGATESDLLNELTKNLVYFVSQQRPLDY